jgi:hypothetical protein
MLLPLGRPSVGRVSGLGAGWKPCTSGYAPVSVRKVRNAAEAVILAVAVGITDPVIGGYLGLFSLSLRPPVLNL